MKKVVSSRKTKIKKNITSLLIALSVVGLTSTVPAFAMEALAAEAIVRDADDAKDGDVLFEDTEDDEKTEKIEEGDTVDPDKNIVVPKEPESEIEEPESETEEPEKGGDCVTPGNGYEEGEGEYWDPDIKDEEEKKGLNDEPTPDEPTPDEPTPDEPTPDEPTPDEPTPDEPTPDEPTPDEPTPKTGSKLTWYEIVGVLAGIGLVSGGVGKVAGVIGENSYAKKLDKNRKSR